jgi:hypothetical protein
MWRCSLTERRVGANREEARTALDAVREIEIEVSSQRASLRDTTAEEIADGLARRILALASPMARLALA